MANLKVELKGYFDWQFDDTSLCFIYPKPKHICYASGHGERLWTLLEDYKDELQDKMVKITIEEIEE